MVGNDWNRPQCDIPQIPGNVSDAAIVTVPEKKKGDPKAAR